MNFSNSWDTYPKGAKIFHKLASPASITNSGITYLMVGWNHLPMLYAIISSFACSAYICLAILILVFGKNSPTQRAFALFCATLTLWSFGSIGQHLLKDSIWVSLFDRIYFTGSELFILTGILFALTLTEGWTSRVYRLILLGITVRMALYQTANWGWNLLSQDFPSGFWFVSHQLFCALESLFIPLIVYRWGRASSLYRQKIQANIIVVSTISGTVIGVLVDFLSGTGGKNPISCTIPLFWVGAICFAILRYGLMRFTPAQIHRELVDRMNRPVFMIDRSWTITDLNDNAKRLIGPSKPPIAMQQVFCDNEAIEKRAAAVMQTETTEFSHTGFIRSTNGNLIPIVTNFSIIRDAWGGSIGILGVCHPQFDLEDFIRRYSLSERQTDILRHILSGNSQAQTADALCISLATVKTHTTGLYNRLGISSRSELYALLQGEKPKDIS